MSQESAAVRVGLRTAQTENLETLRKNFGLSDGEVSRCLFFRKDQDEPWIPPDLIEAIARKTGKFQGINALFDQYVEPLKQIVYTASVTDEFGRQYVRSGVATLGEKPNGADIETGTLACGRALTAALTAAGYNPFRASSIVDLDQRRSVSPTPPFSGQPLDEAAKQLHATEDAAALRKKDLAQIHKLATDKGLIDYQVGGDKDLRRYRNWLEANFRERSAVEFDATKRALVINKLTEYNRDDDYIQHLSAELREDALIA
jgi:hypothetical protein